MKNTIAVLDDEPRMAEALAMLLRREGWDVQFFTDPGVLFEAFSTAAFDVVLTDLKMPQMDGVEVLQYIKKLSPSTPVILMTAFGTVQTAIAAMREGAFDYLEKPFDNQVCISLIQRALQMTQLERENRALREACQRAYGLNDMIAVSSAMQDVLERAKRAATSRSTVLITGESGTGKELIARAVHLYSDRMAQPLISINCASLSSNLLESELFGHEKGAFTGATERKIGLFEQAHKGTLFLDEIGEIDEAFQVKLLRVLQEREVRRVGASTVQSVDVRIVAATHRELHKEVEAGRFREDLFFRLAVIPIEVPPLRERPEDILPLARHFLSRWSRTVGRFVVGWDAEAEQQLLEHTWPGNVRELENALERAVVFARTDCVTRADLGVHTLRSMQRQESRDALDTLPLHDYLDVMTERRIIAALDAAQGVRIDAARALGIERTTLYRLMKKLHIEQKDSP